MPDNEPSKVAIEMTADTADAVVRIAASSVYCTATKRNGEPCRAPASSGMTVCVIHGGGTTRSRKKAERVIDELRVYLLEQVAPQAVGRVEELLQSSTDERTVLAAANSVLDRVGLGATVKQEVTVQRSPQDDQLDALIEQAIERRAMEIAGVVEDAELVEDDG